MSTRLVDKSQREAFLAQFDNFLFDCDGVLWEGSRVFPGIVDAMTTLRRMGKRVCFVTNNSTKSRASFLDKLRQFGIHADMNEIFSSAFATAVHLKHVLHFPAEKKAYIIGMSGIKEEFALEGIRSCGAEEDNGVQSNDPVADDPEVGAVVVGLDTQVNYRKYAKAFTYLRRNPGCLFIMTNGDTTFPIHGTLFPGAGSIASPLITALDRQPDAILGKPSQHMLQAIFAEHSFDPAKTCMIGDRLDTDIAFGNEGGLTTLCVLTGVTSEEQVLSSSNNYKPTFYMDSFANFNDVCLAEKA